MTDKVIEESNQDGGTEGVPNPAGSAGSGDSQSSQFDAAQLLEQLGTLIDKKLQSSKDSRIAKLEKSMSDIQAALDGLKPSSDPQAGKPEGHAEADVTQDIDEALHLPANDSRVVDLHLKYGKDPVAYVKEAAKLSALLGGQKESTPAEQPLPVGTAAPAGDNPIANINDSRTLYRIAAAQIAQGKGRGAG